MHSAALNLLIASFQCDIRFADSSTPLQYHLCADILLKEGISSLSWYPQHSLWASISQSGNSLPMASRVEWIAIILVTGSSRLEIKSLDHEIELSEVEPFTLADSLALRSSISRKISSRESLDSISALDFDASWRFELLRAIPYLTSSRDKIADSLSSLGISPNLTCEIVCRILSESDLSSPPGSLASHLLMIEDTSILAR